MIGISDNAWGQVQAQLGPKHASHALALVFDKHCSGEVKSPTGYLRGMMRKEREGELHLERSFFGRIIREVSV